MQKQGLLHPGWCFSPEHVVIGASHAETGTFIHPGWCFPPEHLVKDASHAETGTVTSGLVIPS
jgi:hypothetical protein